MKIEHIAIWVKELEEMKDFYVKYFGMSCGEKYVNPAKGYSSYFLSYGEPRTTGNGYYESVVLDPEGNYIEITEKVY